MYFFLHDVNVFYDKLITNGVLIHNEIGDRDYQMRDFDVVDNTGYLLAFGTGMVQLVKE